MDLKRHVGNLNSEFSFKFILIFKIFLVNVDFSRILVVVCIPKSTKDVEISASADGGPRSHVCARRTLRSAPHQH